MINEHTASILCSLLYQKYLLRSFKIILFVKFKSGIQVKIGIGLR